MVGNGLKLVLGDFGFASFKDMYKLTSYKGTQTYMAPEIRIKEYLPYDGKQADIFSLGVCLFIMVQGHCPFKEATKDDFFYKLIVEGNLSTYWQKTASKALSDEFKDLIL